MSECNFTVVLKCCWRMQTHYQTILDKAEIQPVWLMLTLDIIDCPFKETAGLIQSLRRTVNETKAEHR